MFEHFEIEHANSNQGIDNNIMFPILRYQEFIGFSTWYHNIIISRVVLYVTCTYFRWIIHLIVHLITCYLGTKKHYKYITAIIVHYYYCYFDMCDGESVLSVTECNSNTLTFGVAIKWLKSDNNNYNALY